MKKETILLGLVVIFLISVKFKEADFDFELISEENCYLQIVEATVPTEEEAVHYIEPPFTGKSFIGFRQALGFKESRNRYHIVNKYGYLGKYQFGKSTLRRLKVRNVENFLRDPEQQEQAFEALCSLNKYILRKDIKRSVGSKINGILITESGILAAAHLSGAGNVKKYLRSGGANDVSDAFGTSIQNYMILFAGYDVSDIEANQHPVI
ncbi:peptidoglycan-binding protein LysM [Urechidicola sp. KH5]